MNNKILKYVTLPGSAEFEAWQLSFKPEDCRIHSITPVPSTITADVCEETHVNAYLDMSVFVVYWECPNEPPTTTEETK